MIWHALATYRRGIERRPALVLEDGCYDLAEAAGRSAHAPAATELASLRQILDRWERVEADIAALAGEAAGLGLPPLAPDFAAPFEPYRLYCAASNYAEHADEMKTKLSLEAGGTPFVFLKSQASVIGPGEPIVLPPQSVKVDWEVELGVVIGAGGRRIPVERAAAAIAGYVVVNDISARDRTRRSDFPFSHDWLRGKSYDSFTPMGPWFVPRACIADPHDLALRLSVNGEIKQDGRTDEMIFNAFEQIAYLSALGRLVAGDVLATGTPAGVGMASGVFLKPGDEVVAEVVGVGRISNPVVAETA